MSLMPFTNLLCQLKKQLIKQCVIVAFTVPLPHTNTRIRPEFAGCKMYAATQITDKVD